MATIKTGGIKEALEKTILKEGEPEIDNTIREGWNKYLDWLEAKGMRGKPELDKNDLGGKMIDAYRKENPDTPISREMVIPIQKEFGKYRDWSLGEVKAGRSMLSEGVTPENYMRALSIVDGFPGQRTTTFKFPLSYMQTFSNGKLISNENKGFATVKNK